jgi:uncharacterized protein YtpQ (UPF0354 family)
MSEILDLESFAAHIEVATRQAGFVIAKREELDLYVLLPGHDEPLRCNLNQIYRAHQSSPHRLNDIVQAHLEALRSVPPPSPPPTEKEAAESLLPMLNRTQWLKEVQRQNVSPIAHRPFAAGLVVTYVFDFPDHRAYINVDMLAKMTGQPEITFDGIHEYALENLRLRTTNRSYETHGLRYKTVIVCEVHDGYAATRVLLPDLMAMWAKRIPGRMLIGIPNRDFLIAFSGHDSAHVAAITRQVRRDARQRDHPLCADLLVWQDGRISEYRPKQ